MTQQLHHSLITHDVNRQTQTAALCASHDDDTAAGQHCFTHITHVETLGKQLMILSQQNKINRGSINYI